MDQFQRYLHIINLSTFTIYNHSTKKFSFCKRASNSSFYKLEHKLQEHTLYKNNKNK